MQKHAICKEEFIFFTGRQCISRDGAEVESFKMTIITSGYMFVDFIVDVFGVSVI
jgi:hypothetical protein